MRASLRITSIRRLAFVLTIAGLTAFSAPNASPANDRDPLPDLMLWAWERPEDLRSLPRGTGVAFLAQTISSIAGRMTIDRRRQPLRVDATTALMAVTRVEVPDVPSLDLTDDMAAAIAQTRALPRVSAIQIDFDATLSQRPFYAALLRDVRTRLDRGTLLSITALASWCSGDTWLGGPPVDEAVPMLFRMGPFHEPFRAIASSSRASAMECRGAVGVSLDEPLTVSREARRVYVFSPRAWTAEAVAAAQRQVIQ